MGYQGRKIVVICKMYEAVQMYIRVFYFEIIRWEAFGRSVAKEDSGMLFMGFGGDIVSVRISGGMT